MPSRVNPRFEMSASTSAECNPGKVPGCHPETGRIHRAPGAPFLNAPRPRGPDAKWI